MKTGGYIIVTLEFYKEGRRWTAYCRELGTATFGRSLPEAQIKIKEAVLLHLNTLEEVGERERFFREHNIPFYSRKPRSKGIDIKVSLDKPGYVQPYIQPLGNACA
ncbi:hypothetical protein LR066_04125 [candidate division WOR-3 bacterium]|nr:hypothetical protein [candidate division WOR-3 bacterium]